LITTPDKNVQDRLPRKRVGVVGSPGAIECCRPRGIREIAGACPTMYRDGVDFGDKCMRWILGFTSGLPT